MKKVSFAKKYLQKIENYSKIKKNVEKRKNETKIGKKLKSKLIKKFEKNEKKN